MESGDTRAVDVAWRLLAFSRENLRTLEENTVRVAAAQIAGLIALWTQLYTFNEVVPAVLAWTALIMFFVSILFLARLVTPRRLARFWESVPMPDVLAGDAQLSFEEEAVIVRELTASMRLQIERLRHGLRRSIAIALIALSVALIGYVIEKAERGIEEPASGLASPAARLWC